MSYDSNPILKLKRKDRLRLVNQCVIDRKSEIDTQEYIYKKSGNKITTRTIRRDKRQLKADATTFFFLLAKDNDEYNHKLKISIDSLEETLSDLKNEYKSAYTPDMKIKIAETILRYEKEIYEYYKFLPMLNSGDKDIISTTTEAEPETSTVF